MFLAENNLFHGGRMMDISLSCSLVQTQKLEVTGGITMSVFPEAEQFLLADSDHQNALRYVASRKDMKRYKSMMDFLFCELYTRYQPACFRFYEKNGPILRDMATQEQINFWGKVLLLAVQKAFEIHSQKRRVSWGQFREEVMRKAA
jgi:hypothetical protein